MSRTEPIVFWSLATLAAVIYLLGVYAEYKLKHKHGIVEQHRTLQFGGKP